MAQRRMFSNRIANSARFLQMPVEAQLLYFHMIIRADDDGIVESYPVMKMLGVAPDNFKVLLAKGMISQLNEDQVIVITDWAEHNIIRADRKINSIYLPLLKKKYPELPIIEPKPRVDVEDNSRRTGSGQSTDGIGKVRLGKVSIEYNNKEGDSAEAPTPKEEAVEFFNSIEELRKGESAEKINELINEFLIKTGAPAEPIKREMIKFASYWTEKNKSGTKQRWELERTFEIKRRLATWFTNASKYQKVEKRKSEPFIV